jgi:hypothetical protein
MFGLKCQPLEGELADHHALLHKYLAHARALCVCVRVRVCVCVCGVDGNSYYLIKLKELECLV